MDENTGRLILPWPEHFKLIYDYITIIPSEISFVNALSNYQIQNYRSNDQIQSSFKNHFCAEIRFRQKREGTTRDYFYSIGQMWKKLRHLETCTNELDHVLRNLKNRC